MVILFTVSRLDIDVAYDEPVIETWEFYQAREPDIRVENTDRADWIEISFDQKLSINPKYGIYGWYRTSFNSSDIDHIDNLTLYFDTIYGSDETYLNGELIGGLGKLNKEWEFLASNPQAMPRSYPISPEILKDGRNELLVKVNLGYGPVSGFNFFGGTGIDTKQVFLTSARIASEAFNQRILSSSIISTVILCLALFEAFVLLLGLRGTFQYFPEFPWLLISVALMISTSMMQDVFYIYDLRNLFVNALSTLALSFSSLIIAMYFWSQFRNVPARLAYSVCAFWSVLALLVLVPATPLELKNQAAVLWQWSGIVLNIYALVTLLIGVKLRHSGSLTILIGLIGYGLSVRSDWLGINIANHHDIMIGSLLLRYALIIAYFQRITNISRNYQKLSNQLVSTIEYHRNEVARELHDDLGQRLAAIKLQLNIIAQEQKNRMPESILGEISGAILSMRRIVRGLHPVGLDTQNLADAILEETIHLEDVYGTKFNFHADSIELDKNIEVQLMRIFQEATANAIRHGEASLVDINLKKHLGGLVLEITDNGKGLKNVKTDNGKFSGFGMTSMHQRAEQINAELFITQSPSNGTSVKLSIAKI